MALFEGLHIHDHWGWSVCHPVVRLSFGRGNFKEPDYVEANLMAQLDAGERQTGVASDYAAGPGWRRCMPGRGRRWRCWSTNTTSR